MLLELLDRQDDPLGRDVLKEVLGHVQAGVRIEREPSRVDVSSAPVMRCWMRKECASARKTQYGPTQVMSSLLPLFSSTLDCST
ncbi:hypothetical protein PR002_g11329 [Phytophthora rubi]|uniref:Uncharacterized protein n=1 Tax=Phytophthora rubi TaxID=129364 RepID=A0A6A3M3C2_9STRA|nr:hypothetical protein PR002_g11329 [Phytophthora rubi]